MRGPGAAGLRTRASGFQKGQGCEGDEHGAGDAADEAQVGNAGGNGDDPSARKHRRGLLGGAR